MKKYRIMVIDDSAVVRQAFKSIVDDDPELEVYAAVANPILALKRMQDDRPDVIILDIEMPEMDGLTFLKKIMAENPIPVLMCSTLTTSEASVTMDALSAGAVGFITKPKIGLKNYLAEESLMLLDAIKASAKVNMAQLKRSVANRKIISGNLNQKIPAKKVNQDIDPKQLDQIIAIGTSTGGTQALEAILVELPPLTQGIVIVQHMPEKFTEAFAKRLNGICEITVQEAKNNDLVRPGLALVAPGGKHMLLRKTNGSYSVQVKDGPLVNRHRPSVDVLFSSTAKVAGKNAMGIIMTGMGSDGAHGLLEMREAGALTLAQTEDTCVVYGMPKEATKLGAVDQHVPLHEMADWINQFSNPRVKKRSS